MIRTVGQVDHHQDVFIGQGATDEIQAVQVVFYPGLALCLYLPAQSFRKDDDGGYLTRLHGQTGIGKSLEPDRFAQLGGI